MSEIVHRMVFPPETRAAGEFVGGIGQNGSGGAL
jgi:hypothetical protein